MWDVAVNVAAMLAPPLLATLVWLIRGVMRSEARLNEARRRIAVLEGESYRRCTQLRCNHPEPVRSMRGGAFI